MRNLCSPSVLHCAPITTRDSDLMKGVMVVCGEWKRSPNHLIPRPTEMVMFEKKVATRGEGPFLTDEAARDEGPGDGGSADVILLYLDTCLITLVS